MAHVHSGSTVLTVTYSFINKWNESYLPVLPIAT